MDSHGGKTSFSPSTFKYRSSSAASILRLPFCCGKGILIPVWLSGILPPLPPLHLNPHLFPIRAQIYPAILVGAQESGILRQRAFRGRAGRRSPPINTNSHWIGSPIRQLTLKEVCPSRITVSKVSTERGKSIPSFQGVCIKITVS